jgi:hypothetical protein
MVLEDDIDSLQNPARLRWQITSEIGVERYECRPMAEVADHND